MSTPVRSLPDRLRDLSSRLIAVHDGLAGIDHLAHDHRVTVLATAITLDNIATELTTQETTPMNTPDDPAASHEPTPIVFTPRPGVTVTQALTDLEQMMSTGELPPGAADQYAEQGVLILPAHIDQPEITP